MKKLIAFLILFTFISNSVFAEVLFYEDFTFYGELSTDVCLNSTDKKQKIQMIFPNFSSKKTPIILNGTAKLGKNNEKSVIFLEFDEMVVDKNKNFPVKVLVTAVNGKKITNGCYPDKNKYISGLNTVNSYTREFAFFPINRFNSIPKVAKPSYNNFLMLLEPVYLAGGIVLLAVSPLTAPFYVKEDFCDIPKGSMLEFQFLREITKEEFKTGVIAPEDL